MAINSNEQQVIETTTPTTQTTNQSSSSSKYYWFLLLLLIPLLLLLFLLFACCFGRYLLRCCRCCARKVCPCCRPNDEHAGKAYDSTVCYSEADELWMEDKFMPKYSQQARGHKIKKMPFQSQQLNTIDSSGATLDKERQETLKSSKRIVLLFTRNFVRNVWSSNADLKRQLKEIRMNDPDCVIVPVNVGDVSAAEMQACLNEIDADEKQTKVGEVRTRMQNRVKHNLGLNDVEPLDWQK